MSRGPDARCTRWRSSAGVLACVGLALLSPGAARGDQMPGRDVRQSNQAAVILPGQEDLFAAMLGRGAALPDGCAFAGGQIERSVARGTYDCPSGEVVVELRHPSGAVGSPPPAEKIAIVTVRGTPPAALLAALRERIRQREDAFEWRQPPEAHVAPRGCWAAPVLENRLGPYVPGCYPRFVALLVGSAQFLVIVLGLGYGLVTLHRIERSSGTF